MNDRTKRQDPAQSTNATGAAGPEAKTMSPRMVQMEAGGNQAAHAEAQDGDEQAMEPTVIPLSGIQMPTYLLALQSDWPVHSIHDVTSAYYTAKSGIEAAGGHEAVRHQAHLMSNWSDALKLDVADPASVGTHILSGLASMVSCSAGVEADAKAELVSTSLVQDAVNDFESWASRLGPNAAIAESTLPAYYEVSFPHGTTVVTRDAANVWEIQELGKAVGAEVTRLLTAWSEVQRLMESQHKANANNRMAYALTGILSGAEVPHDEVARAYDFLNDATNAYHRWCGQNHDFASLIEGVNPTLDFFQVAAGQMQGALNAVSEWRDDLGSTAETTAATLRTVQDGCVTILAAYGAVVAAPLLAGAMGGGSVAVFGGGVLAAATTAGAKSTVLQLLNEGEVNMIRVTEDALAGGLVAALAYPIIAFLPAALAKQIHGRAVGDVMKKLREDGNLMEGVLEKTLGRHVDVTISRDALIDAIAVDLLDALGQTGQLPQ